MRKKTTTNVDISFSQPTTTISTPKLFLRTLDRSEVRYYLTNGLIFPVGLRLGSVNQQL
jgi:hypothetical protein